VSKALIEPSHHSPAIEAQVRSHAAALVELAFLLARCVGVLHHAFEVA
jgi:hypothetical protein